MVFAYLGPQPAPLLPRWDLFVRTAERDIGWAVIPCNWLQIMENSLDPVHVEWLHQYFSNYVSMDQPTSRPEATARAVAPRSRSASTCSSTASSSGACSRAMTEDIEEWAVGHPRRLPEHAEERQRPPPRFQIRVPMDDTHTTYCWYSVHTPDRHRPPRPRRDALLPGAGAGLDPTGNLQWDLLDNNSGQDMVMWYTQGEITDRDEEHLGLSDKGVILYRKQLEENLRKVERGEDPMNTFRDPATNQSIAARRRGDEAGQQLQHGGRQAPRRELLEVQPALQSRGRSSRRQELDPRCCKERSTSDEFPPPLRGRVREGGSTSWPTSILMSPRVTPPAPPPHQGRGTARCDPALFARYIRHTREARCRHHRSVERDRGGVCPAHCARAV